MEKTVIQLISLRASEGCYITQRADVPLEERFFTEVLHLGKNDESGNYKEVTQEEKDAYEI